MSGPKISTYTLTNAQRRELERQRREEEERQRKIEEQKRLEAERLRKIEEEKQNLSFRLKTNMNKIRSFSTSSADDKRIALLLSEKSGNDNGFIRESERILAMCNKAEQICQQANLGNLDSSRSANSRVAAILDDVIRAKQNLDDIAARNKKTLSNMFLDEIELGYSTSYQEGYKNLELENEKALAIEELEGILICQDLSTIYREEIENSINTIKQIDNSEYLRNYRYITIKPLVAKCRKYIDEYKKYYSEYETLIAEYIALCKLYHYESASIPFSFESIAILKSEITRIKDEAAKDDEQRYISRSVDEVMREMGYDVLGNRNVQKRNGKRFRHELFSFDDGKAVDVTYSSDGRISMELGGLDDTDRTPNSTETAELCDSMEEFCEVYNEIERRLLAKGIVAHRISQFPPKPAYAQIINVSDYNMLHPVGKMRPKKIHTSTKKKTQTPTEKKSTMKE